MVSFFFLCFFFVVVVVGFFFLCVCVHSPLHTYGDIHMKTHQESGDCSNYGDIFESPRKKSPKIGSSLKIDHHNEDP